MRRSHSPCCHGHGGWSRSVFVRRRLIVSLRSVTLPGTTLSASCIGFGCASLGSRIGRAAGARALDEAFDAGVTWYDVAPPYGADEAEGILGAFLRGRRDRVRVCTKVGLVGPRRGRLMKLAYALARPVVGRAKALRRGFRAVPATRYRRLALDGDAIRTSLDESLRRLGTDHVDVFALHDPADTDVVRDDVVRALEEVVASGKARHLSVAGGLAACLAGAGVDLPYGIAQIADDPRAKTLDAFSARAPRPLAAVTHSVFGIDGMLDELTGRLRSDAVLTRRLAEAGYEGDAPRIASDLLLDRAFASNPDGVVLVSMFGAEHRASNLARASRLVRRESVALLSEILAETPPR